MTRAPLVVVTSSFPVRGDGSEAAGSFVSDLVEELAQHQPVRVIAPGGTVELEQRTRNIEIHRYAAPTRPLSTLKPWHPADVGWIWKVLRGGSIATHQAVSDDATHVLALWGLPCGEWARRAAHAAGINYSVWLLGSDVWSLGRIPVLRQILARVIRQAAHAWADGYKLAEDAQCIAAAPVGFLPSTRHIINTKPPPPRSKPPYRLLFLGRWHPNKGVDLLLDALALLDDSDWQQIECVEIQGGGPLELLVHERISSLRAAHRPVELGGFLKKTEAEAALVRADWVMIPSYVESIPVIFSDAMKLGRPVIATPVGDLPKLVGDLGCGIVADDVSATKFCCAVRAALSEFPRNLEAAMQKQAAFFDLISIAKNLSLEIDDND